MFIATGASIFHGAKIGRASDIRINGVVRNIPEFYSAFGVKPGDALYLPPEERVKIW